MWNDTPLTRRLGLRYPIVQGPFGGGFSSARLTATVSNAGGLGSFGAQGQPPARMAEIIGDIRAADGGAVRRESVGVDRRRGARSSRERL